MTPAVMPEQQLAVCVEEGPETGLTLSVAISELLLLLAAAAAGMTRMPVKTILKNTTDG